MFWKHPLFLILSSLFLSGCTLYQSDGREFLEDNAFEFAQDNLSSGVQWNFKAYQIERPCAELFEEPTLSKKDWSFIDQVDKDQGKLFQSESPEYIEVLFYKVSSDQRHFLCAFHYDSLKDQMDKLNTDLLLAESIIQNLESHFAPPRQ